MFIGNVVALLLILIGAINWGLVGFFDYNAVGMLFGDPSGTYSMYSRIVYAIVGLAGIWGLSFLRKVKDLCSGCDHNHHHRHK